MNTISLERAIIGCILIDGSLFEKNKAELSQKDFSDSTCQAIYGAMVLLEYAGMPIDPVLVFTKLSSINNDISEQDIYEIASQAPTGRYFDDYVIELFEIRGEEFSKSESTN